MHHKVSSLHLRGGGTTSGKSQAKTTISGHTGGVYQGKTWWAFVHHFNNFLPNIQGPFLVGRRENVALDENPSVPTALPVSLCFSLTTAPRGGLSSSFYRWGNRHTGHWVVGSRAHTYKMAEVASKLNSAQPNPHASSCRRNKDIIDPPETDPWTQGERAQIKITNIRLVQK